MSYLELPPEQRVVVTGMGALSPVGLNVKESFSNLIAGKSGIVALPEEFRGHHVIENGVEKYVPFHFYNDYGVNSVGQISEYNDEFFADRTGIGKNKLKNFSKAGAFALIACAEALFDAGLAPENSLMFNFPDKTKFAVSIGSGIAGVQDIVPSGHDIANGKAVKPSYSMKVFPERVATVISIQAGITGPTHYSSAACASGNDAIIDLVRKIKLGEVSAGIAGGTESQISLHGFGMFAGLHAMDKGNPEQTSRPFNKTEGGFVLAEGAGIFVLESLKSALERDVEILAEIVGYGDTSDAEHDTMLNVIGSQRAINDALKDVDLDDKNIYVNAHATGTNGDKKELEAIKNSIPSKNLLAISSSKGATGHMLGAAGSFESIVCVKALQTGQIPPTLKLDDPVEIARDMPVIANFAVELPINLAVNNSFGFGGQNRVVAFAKYPQ